MPRLVALLAVVSTVAGLVVATTTGTATATAPRSSVSGLTGSAATPGLASISVGTADACAIRTGGAVACWGANALALSGSFIQVSVGNATVCGLKSDATMACSGGSLTALPGTFRQLSVGSSFLCAIKLDATVQCSSGTPPSNTFRQISVGDADACGVQLDGTTTCWGTNNLVPTAGTYTQVAVGDQQACGLGVDAHLTCWGNVAVTTPSQSLTFSQISMAGAHGCGVQTDGTASCFGTDDQTSPGSGTYVAVSTGSAESCGVQTDGTASCWPIEPTTPAAPPQFNFGHPQVSAGAASSCGVRTDGTLACWGQPPAGMPSTGTFTDVSDGTDHACGVQTVGTVVCWGDDTAGKSDPPATLFTQVAVGGAYSCGVAVDSTLSCWGSITGTPASGSFVEISAGATHACALATGGTVQCWGDATLATLGTPAATTFTDVSAGSDFSCGVQAADATLVCWGSDAGVVAGAPTGTYSSVSSGTGYACALRTAGTTTCWGRADGPVDPPTTAFVQLGAGADHTCGVATDGTVTCWGDDETVPDLIVAPFTQDITIDPPDDPVYNQSGDATVTGAVPGSSVLITSSTPTVCTVAGQTVSYLHAQDCTLAAHRDATDDFAAADQTATFSIDKATPDIQLSPAPDDPVVDGDATITATITPLEVPADEFTLVAQDTSPNAPCTVSSGGAANVVDVHFVHAATCVVVATLTEPSGGDYTGQTANQTITIGKATPTIAVAAPTDPVVGQPVSLSSSSQSDGQFSYGTSTPDICTVNAGGSATLQHAGTCTAVVTQVATNDYTSNTKSKDFVVGKAATTMTAAVTGAALHAQVSVDAPSTAEPTGKVIFSVDGATVGTADIDDTGAASLTYTVPTTGGRHAVTAQLDDQNADFLVSSASTARRNPGLTTAISSNTPETKYRWYRSPVTVTFACVKTTANLATNCPSSHTFTASKANQSITRTIMAHDGGIATRSVTGINIDQTKPKVVVAGVTDGTTYVGKAPKARCLPSDSLSGVASCHITLKTDATGKTKYTATAADKAGNTASVTGSYRVQRYYLREAIYDASNNSYIVQTATKYTLVALAAHRPYYYKPVRLHHTPNAYGGEMSADGKQAGIPRWTRTVSFSRALRKHTFWNIGILAGGTVHSIILRVT